MALLIPCLLTGGTEVATLETAKAFLALGYAVDVLVYFDEIDPAMLSTFEDSGIRVHRLGVCRDAGWPALLDLAAGLLKALIKGRYALVCVQYMTPTFLPLLMARLWTRRLIAAVHVAAGHYRPGGLRRMRGLARWWCTRFICVSETTATGIFGAAVDGKRLGGRVVVIPNALDMAAVQAAERRNWRDELDLPPDAVVIGYVGRLAHNKGVDLLLRAVARLDRMQQPLAVVVVGDGAELTRLRALAVELGIASFTHFVGSIPRHSIYSAIKGFDIAVVPSREEGFGLSALEALAAGVPLVASRVDALEEVVVDGGTGVLCEVENPDSLGAGLMRLLSDDKLRRQMGAAGLAHAGALYDSAVHRVRIAALLQSIGLSPGLRN